MMFRCVRSIYHSVNSSNTIDDDEANFSKSHLAISAFLAMINGRLPTASNWFPSITLFTLIGMD